MLLSLLYLIGVLYTFLNLSDNVENSTKQLALFSTASIAWPLFVATYLLQQRNTLLILVMDLLEVPRQEKSTVFNGTNPQIEELESF